MTLHRFLLLALFTVSSLAAQTTISNPVGAVMGSSHGLFDDQFLGTRFTLAQDFSVTSISADFAYGNNQNLFAAIVFLPNATVFPTASATNGLAQPSEVVFTTLFNPGQLTNQLTTITVPVAVDLTAGSYAVVFGAGQFGSSTTASGGLQNYHLAAGGDAIAWTAPSTAWSETQLDFIAGGVPSYSIAITGNATNASVPDSFSTVGGVMLALLSLRAANRRLKAMK